MKYSPRSLLVAGAAALTLALAPATAGAQGYINILTGGQAGVYYPLGVALEKVFADNIEGKQPSVQSTKASVENMNLLQAGRGEIAFALGDSVKSAWEGDEEAGFPQKLENLRVIAAIYPNYVQIVASKESGIKSLEDLKGKRVSVGAPRSGTELNARRIFEAAGMSYEDLGKVEYLPFAESVELMKNRQIDATLQSAGLGVASIRDLSTSIPVTVVSVPEEVVTTLGAPYVSETIPAGTYDGQDEDVRTVAITNYLVSHTGVSDELAYDMTKAVFEHLDQLVNAHSAAKAISLENAAKGAPAPLHPGAEKYFKEAGAM